MRQILIVLFALLPVCAIAQERDSRFADYAAYAEFADSRIARREFIELIQVLGGRDEYTPEQLRSLQGRFVAIYPVDFIGRAVVKETDLGAGFRQEMRIYWNQGSGYLYFYAMLHERDDEIVVLNFVLNSDVSKVLAEF
ncbi:MAG: hypothetical protein ACK5MY_17820 [Jhaorihella sp.]